jgi:hypothetical protein
MNKHVNFEDALFILNAQVRMIRDMLRLDPDPGLFLEKTATDLEFIDRTLEILTGNLFGNTRLLDREIELDHLSDIEWEFDRLLTEFAGGASPFSAGAFPEICGRILPLRNNSAARRKAVGESAAPAERASAEPVVSSLELSELLQRN